MAIGGPIAKTRDRVLWDGHRRYRLHRQIIGAHRRIPILSTVSTPPNSQQLATPDSAGQGRRLGGFAKADWKTELDTLVKETMAFAKSHRVEPPMPLTIDERNRIPLVKGIESEREEIRQRVANFQAHQQRFISEREDYASSEWKRILASPSLLVAPPSG